MNKKYILIIFILCQSCTNINQSNHNNSIPFIKTKYNINTNKKIIDSCFYNKIYKANETEFLYYVIDNKDTNFYIYLRTLKFSDSLIIKENDTCLLAQIKDFKVKNKYISVYKYILKRENSFDNKQSIFINENHGILCIYNKNWNVIEMFESDKISILLNNIILKDSIFLKN
jgi:hypothetical protein